MNKKDNSQKSIFTKWWFLLLFAVFIYGYISSGNASKNSITKETPVAVEETSSLQTEETTEEMTETETVSASETE